TYNNMSINFYTDADGVTLSVKNNWVEALPLLYENLTVEYIQKNVY
ncbi:22949_t:CDS:1, partial [Rhizophagus irregularis]